MQDSLVRMVELRKRLTAALDLLEMRPWIPAAVFGGAAGMVALVPFVRFVDALDSRWRIIPHYSKDFILFLGNAMDVLGVAAFYVWIAVMLVPLFPLVARRFKTAGYVFVLNLAATLSVACVVFLTIPLLFCFALDQDELRHAEKERVRAIDVSSRYDFGPDKRYLFVDRIGEEGESYDLYDVRINRCLAEQVVKWDEKGGELIFSTKSGKRCALSYDQGRVSEIVNEK